MKFVIFLAIFAFFYPLTTASEDDSLTIETILTVDATIWKIPESQTVGSEITTIKQDTMIPYEVTFSLEKGADISYSAKSRKPLSLPFSINATDGRVILRESLAGRVREQINRNLLDYNYGRICFAGERSL
jgi:hypothetical protein